MNISFITPEFVTEKNFDGGLSNYVYKMSLAFIERGHNVFVIVSSNENNTLAHDGISIIRVDIQSRFLSLFQKLLRGRFYAPLSWLMQSWKLNKRLRALDKNTKIDIAQFSSYTATGFFRPKNIPSVVRVSSYQPALDKVNELKIGLTHYIQYYLEGSAFKKSDAIFGPSKVVNEIVENKTKQRVELIESPLSSNIASDPDVFKSILAGKKYLLFFGSLGILKGVLEITDIIYELLQQYPDLYFVFVGKDFGYKGMSIMNAVWEYAGKNRGRCLYLGSMKQMFLQPIVKNAYAVILPSRIDNFPNTCLESMAQGKIVVGTRGASFEQLINHGDNGFLCEIKNPESLLSGVIEALRLDLEQKKQIERSARETVKRLRPAKIAKELEKFYIKVIQGEK